MLRTFSFSVLGQFAALCFLVNCSQSSMAQQTPAAPQRVTVAANGSGDFQTVQQAVNAAPTDKAKRFVIALKPGIYREKLVIAREKGPITLQGDDAATTTLTFDDSAGKLDAEGKPLGIGGSYSASIASDDFIAENLTFENTHQIGGGVGNQAIALSFQGDRGVFRKCRFLGKQDTLYLARNRQYFEDCFLRDEWFAGNAGRRHHHREFPGFQRTRRAVARREKHPFARCLPRSGAVARARSARCPKPESGWLSGTNLKRLCPRKQSRKWKRQQWWWAIEREKSPLTRLGSGAMASKSLPFAPCPNH